MEKLLLLPGDGIGPSIIDAAEKTVSMVTDSVEIVRGDIGFDAYERTGEFLPSDTFDLIRECGTAICGPLNNYTDGSGRTVDIMDSLRVDLDLYATVRTFRTLADGFGAPGVNAVLWASNTTRTRDVSESRDLDGITISKYIRSSSYSRMMARAMTDAELADMKNVCCITNSDLFPDSSALFRESFDQLFSSDRFDVSHLNIPQWASKVVRNPAEYEFIVCADLYSTVAAGILAGLTGGNHLSPVGYVGDSNILLFPGLMTTYADIPEGVANPTSAIVSVCMALFNLGMTDEAYAIVGALRDTYAAGELTPDLGGGLSTSEFTDRVLSRL